MHHNGSGTYGLFSCTVSFTADSSYYYLIISGKLQHLSAAAVGLGHVVIVLQNHQIRVASSADLSFPVVHAQASGRVDGAGIKG